MVVIEPGAVKTEWSAIAAENVKNISGNGPYSEQAEATARLFMDDGMSTSPQKVAEVIYRAASARHPKTRYVAPFAVNIILTLRRLLSDRLFDRVWGRITGVPTTISYHSVDR